VAPPKKPLRCDGSLVNNVGLDPSFTTNWGWGEIGATLLPQGARPRFRRGQKMKTLVVALLALAPVWSRAPSYSQMRGPRTKRVAIKALAKQERFARDVDKLIAGVRN
jgi:hypothetical protein